MSGMNEIEDNTSREETDHSTDTSNDEPTEAHRYKLLVCYDGHDFHGWQKQEPKDADPLRTAQGVLEEAVRRVVREPVNVLGASRTDAGVSAQGQVAAFTTTNEMRVPLERLHLAINSKLPNDIAVLSAQEVDLSFNPISDVVRKGYRYTIHNSPIRPVFNHHHLNHYPHHLDAGAMNEAAQYLIGEHDFVSFANTHHGRESTVRTVDACTVHRDEYQSQLIYIDISGSGFLYHMVRIIAGTLIEVGRGKWEPSEIMRILEARDRVAAGPTLPPEGLCLKWIEYREM